MKYIGTIIVHSILQGGPGFPIFSPSVYRYFSTGNFELAMRTANIGECTAHIKNFIDQVIYLIHIVLHGLSKNYKTSALTDNSVAGHLWYTKQL